MKVVAPSRLDASRQGRNVVSILLTPPQPIHSGPPTPEVDPKRRVATPDVIERQPGVPASEDAGAVPPAIRSIEWTSPLDDDDAQMARAVKMGALVGIPGVFLIAAGMALLAGTGLGIAALIGTWSGVFGGMYMGGIFFLHPSNRKLANAAAAAAGQRASTAPDAPR